MKLLLLCSFRQTSCITICCSDTEHASAAVLALHSPIAAVQTYSQVLGASVRVISASSC